ncbi:ABC transporter ATP-binding protein [Lapillicoccus sp.]|uniref:ABC transporter ATP-binding protein n=1 Tax=Lapillicoccus sp. TaxID=1909287 RepID=UPI003263A207
MTGDPVGAAPPTDPRREPVLSVRDLRTTFVMDTGVVEAVRGVSFDLYPGEILGLVGESGSGKSALVSSVMGLLRSPPANVGGGPVTFGGRNLLTESKAAMRRVRGEEIAMIFQDPMTSFNPVRSIGQQISEAIRVHHRVSRRAAKARTVELLALVGMPSPTVRYAQFPHEFSGGMRQRAMIAMAMANQPKVIIADEPTTALDVTVQAQILQILQAAQAETDAAILLITHDLGLVAELADRVLVMYAGRVVESSDVFSLFAGPKHPYTLGLLASLPRIGLEVDQLVSIPGRPPSLSPPPLACAFRARCQLSHARERCRVEDPALRLVGDGHASACHFSDEMAAGADLAAGGGVDGVSVDGAREPLR